jgi:hypothetical protein
VADRCDNVRQSPVGQFIGCRLVEVTQHDPDEAEEEGKRYVALHFDNGGTLTFPVTDLGFDIETIENDT